MFQELLWLFIGILFHELEEYYKRTTTYEKEQDCMRLRSDGNITTLLHIAFYDSLNKAFVSLPREYVVKARNRRSNVKTKNNLW